MSHDELKAALKLTFLDRIGDVTARKLIDHLGSAEAVLMERKGLLEKLPGVGPALLNALKAVKEVEQRVEEELAFIEEKGLVPFCYGQPDFPSRLCDCYDAPIVLYTKGNVNLEAPRMLGVVGTRRMTSYGKERCRAILEEMAGTDIVIVSGMAYGVDIQAHRIALRSDLPTIAVLAHGLDRIYPLAHQHEAGQMLANGGWVTEFPSGTRPDRENFPKRNRIIAGLVDGLLVIESAYKGGAMITAEVAFSYDRDVLALPGRSEDLRSQGCNNLIKQNKAALVETGEDVLRAMNWAEETSPERKKEAPVQPRLFPDLDENEQKLVTVLQEKASTHLDDLSVQAGLPVHQVSTVLLGLEMKGVVESRPGKLYALS